MTSALSPRDRRAIVFAAAVLLPALTLVYGVRPFVGALAERHRAVAQQRDLLERERALVNAASQYAAPMAAQRMSLAVELPRAVRSAARATATVQLADYVRGAARQHEVLVTQTNDIPADSLTPGVLLLRLAIRAESDLAGLLRFLRAIEQGRQHTRVTRLFIERASPLRERGGDGSGEPLHVLRMSATVEAPAVLSGELTGRGK